MSNVIEQVKRVFDPDSLRSVILFVTAACNFRCPFCCYADNLNQGGDMTFDQMETIARTTGPFHNLLVSGGEPFLRKDLPAIFRAFRRHAGVRIYDVPTNGWYLEKIVGHVQDFCASEPDAQLTVGLSLDGFGEVNDTVRKMPGAFDHGIKTLEALLPLREKLPNLRVKIGSVLTCGNADSIQQLMDHAHEKYPDLDEYTIEIERGIDLDRADFEGKRELTQHYMRLVQRALSLFYGKDNRRARRTPGVPRFISQLLYPGVLNCTTQVKIDRIQGKPWPYECTAGRNIIVINSKGELAACELRSRKVKLADHGYDVQRAVASSEFQEEVRRLRAERCHCTHGCFVDTSLRQSGGYYVSHVPAAGVMQKFRTPS